MLARAPRFGAGAGMHSHLSHETCGKKGKTMKRVIALHTVKSVYESFSVSLPESLPPDTIIDHMVDEFLANDPARHQGAFSKANLARFHALMMQAQATHPDVILVTCSTLSPYVDGCRAFLEVPVIAIDDAMCESAVARGSRICVLATAASALDPTVRKIHLVAERAGAEVMVQGICDPEAIAALKRGEKEVHDARLLSLSRQGSGFDVIVLAQASMAHMREAIEASRGIPTLSSPQLCVASVVRALEA